MSLTVALLTNPQASTMPLSMEMRKADTKNASEL